MSISELGVNYLSYPWTYHGFVQLNDEIIYILTISHMDRQTMNDNSQALVSKLWYLPKVLNDEIIYKL